MDRDVVRRRVGGRRWRTDAPVEPCSFGSVVADQAYRKMTHAQCETKSCRTFGWAGSNFGGEFDPGSGLTLAACLMHASRT